MDKTVLRRQLLDARRAVNFRQRSQWDRQITQQILTWAKEHQPRTMGVYWSIQSEPDLFICYQELAASGIVLSLPVVIGQGQPLRYASWRPGQDTVRGAMGVPVPAHIEHVAMPEVLIIPCVGHNAQGNRLGYGGGFYDRTLATTPRPLTIGISYPCLQVEFEVSEYDIPLDMIFCGE
ncbi:MAG: 5-formyltetrahydrofolate cyclo-ligase [Burkholderiales bacterium]|nr:5-formyltetrahydrofolate cyclo-ligase [Burkholderiales bacterium]